VQHELVKAVSGPMATKQRAAGKAATEAQERLEQVQGHLQEYHLKNSGLKAHALTGCHDEGTLA